MTSPVMAVKTLSVKHWEHSCSKCGGDFHVEEDMARMAPDAPLYVAPSEHPFSVLDRRKGVICPHWWPHRDGESRQGQEQEGGTEPAGASAMAGGRGEAGCERPAYGGSAQDDVAATTRWDNARASKIRLLEVRGALPEEVTDPKRGHFCSAKWHGTEKSHYVCAACGTTQDVLTTIKATGKTGPMAAYAVHGYAPKRDAAGKPYSGRFFAAYDASARMPIRCRAR
jgi:DNA-directed RNA polymerase subunit RPC12/RpoP